MGRSSKAPGLDLYVCFVHVCILISVCVCICNFFCKCICMCDVTICRQICQSPELQASWTDTGAQIHPPEKAEIPTSERILDDATYYGEGTQWTRGDA